jgi:RNA polymerase sigma-70 factor (ECF subfamily)
MTARTRTAPVLNLDVTQRADPLFSPAGMPDAELVARARAGDTGALRDLVERYYDDCWRYAYRMLGDRADAEDAAQETFLRAMAALNDYQERAQFRQWLFTILVNQCRNALVARARRRRRFVSSAELPADDPRRGIVEPTPVADDELARAVAQLEPEQREALLLRFGEGMDYVQMSLATGASQSALKMRVKRARDRLRDLLQGARR